jgi:DNA-binding LacI/PurR family transcriptional regulator
LDGSASRGGGSGVDHNRACRSARRRRSRHGLPCPQRLRRGQPGHPRRVKEAIDALDYEPSAAARALSTGRTLAVGIVAPFATRPSVIERLRGAARHISAAGYQLVLLDVDRPEHLAGAVRSVAVKGRFDGLLVISLPLRESAVSRVRSAGIPLVLIDREEAGLAGVPYRRRGRWPARRRAPPRAGPREDRVLGDDESNPYGFDSSARRRAGYEAALRDAGVQVRPELVVTGPHGRSVARSLATQLPRPPPPADGDLRGVRRPGRRRDRRRERRRRGDSRTISR